MRKRFHLIKSLILVAILGVLACDSAKESASVSQPNSRIVAPPAAQPAEMTTKIYTIREEDGPKIVAQIKSVLSADKTKDPGRKIIVEGKNLIIHDTSDHIRQIEELLMDNKFIDTDSPSLQKASFSLVPNESIMKDADKAQSFAKKTVEKIEAMLYSKEGKEKAQKDGRRLQFDPVTYQLTIIDYPDRLEQVSRLLASLPELQRSPVGSGKSESSTSQSASTSQTASTSLSASTSQTAAAFREEMLPIRNLAAGPFADLVTMKVKEAEQKDCPQTTISLHVGETANADGLAIRLKEIKDGDKSKAGIPRQAILEVTGKALALADYGFGAVDGHEIWLSNLYALPDGGRAYLRVVRTDDKAPASLLDKLQITPIKEQNSLLVRYGNESDLIALKDVVKNLDQPIPQVIFRMFFYNINKEDIKLPSIPRDNVASPDYLKFLAKAEGQGIVSKSEGGPSMIAMDKETANFALTRNYGKGEVGSISCTVNSSVLSDSKIMISDFLLVVKEGDKVLNESLKDKMMKPGESLIYLVNSSVNTANEGQKKTSLMVIQPEVSK